MSITQRKECNCMMCDKCGICHDELKFEICNSCSQCKSCAKCVFCGTEAHKLC